MIKNIFIMVEDSTVPGLAHLDVREDKKKTPKGFLDARSKVDGAEELWRIRNGLYDLRDFIKSHPGGAEWLRLTKGTDVTELFEVSNCSRDRQYPGKLMNYSRSIRLIF